jgi:hypothetical protein
LACFSHLEAGGRAAGDHPVDQGRSTHDLGPEDQLLLGDAAWLSGASDLADQMMRAVSVLRTPTVFAMPEVIHSPSDTMSGLSTRATRS